MSSGRLALVLTLGIATYMASQEPERRTPRARGRSTPASPTAEAADGLDAPARLAEPAARGATAASQPIAIGVPFTLAVPQHTGVVSTPTLAQVKLPVTLSGPVEMSPPRAVPPPDVPPPRETPSALTPEQLQALASLGTNMSDISRQLTALSTEVERLNQWRTASEQANRRAARPMRSVPAESGRLETAAGAPPVHRRSRTQPARSEAAAEPRAPRSLMDEPGDILGLGRVTDNLMKRIERLED